MASRIGFPCFGAGLTLSRIFVAASLNLAATSLRCSDSLFLRSPGFFFVLFFVQAANQKHLCDQDTHLNTESFNPCLPELRNFQVFADDQTEESNKRGYRSGRNRNISSIDWRHPSPVYPTRYRE